MADAENGLAGVRVLVIEDESMVAMLFEDNLAEFGCEIVAVASDLADALEKAAALAFDVAILDVNLNGRSSVPVAESLVRRGIAFVVATGYAAAGLAEPLRRAPILAKPFRRGDLQRVLRTALVQLSDIRKGEPQPSSDAG